MKQITQEKDTLSKSESESLKAYQLMENQFSLLDRVSFRVALTGVFTALSVILGYMLIFLPNIELITLMIFLSGFMIGKKEGLLVGAFSSFIFCFFNPMGSSSLPLFTVQLTYYSSVGLMGGITKQLIQDKKFFKPSEDLYVYPVLIIFGTLAVVMTTLFSVFIEFAGYISIAGAAVPFLTYFLLGIPYSIIHIIGNLLGFVIILPGLIQLLYKLLD